MTGDYWMVSVALEGEAAAEAVANLLWEAGALGVVETETAAEADRPARSIQAFFPPGADAEGVGGRIAGLLDDLGALGLLAGAAPPAVATAPLPEAPWADAWREHFRPLEIGRDFLVCPPWDTPGAGGGSGERRRILVIEPGRAFGTGAHATTQGCLELLERTVGPPAGRQAHVVDIGTGSGILAVAAALLGVGRVDAIDPDPDATAAAKANAERNGVHRQVHVWQADLRGWADWVTGAREGPPPPGGEPPAAAPLVLANLLAGTLAGEAAALGRVVSAEGRLVAGGLLVHEVPAVVAAFVPHGFRLVEVSEREGWAALLLSRERDRGADR